MMSSFMLHLLFSLICINLVLGQQQVTYPMGVCDVVLDSNNNEATGAVVSNTGDTSGPFDSQKVFSFSNTGSALRIPISAFGITGDRLSRIAFYIKTNSAISGKKLLFQIIDINGNGLRVFQDGLQLQLNTTFKSDPSVTNHQFLKLSTFTVTQSTWHAFSLRVGEVVNAFGIRVQDQFAAGKDGSSPVVENDIFAKFVSGEVTIFQFDGGVSCLFLSVDSGDASQTATALLTQQCSSYAVMCPLSATTAAAEPTTAAAEPTTAAAEPTTAAVEPTTAAAEATTATAEPVASCCTLTCESKRQIDNLNLLKQKCQSCTGHNAQHCWQRYHRYYRYLSVHRYTFQNQGKYCSC